MMLEQRSRCVHRKFDGLTLTLLPQQIFVLDQRSHHAMSIHHPNLSEMQGPALLAYNDALFTEEDWTALQNIHRSSKRTDTS